MVHTALRHKGFRSTGTVSSCESLCLSTQLIKWKRQKRRENIDSSTVPCYTYTTVLWVALLCLSPLNMRVHVSSLPSHFLGPFFRWPSSLRGWVSRATEGAVCQPDCMAVILCCAKGTGEMEMNLCWPKPKAASVGCKPAVPCPCSALAGSYILCSNSLHLH